MVISVQPNFILNLNSEEIRLVVAALYGGLKEDQIKPALELQKLIAESRAFQLRDMANSAEKYLSNLDKK